LPRAPPRLLPRLSVAHLLPRDTPRSGRDFVVDLRNLPIGLAFLVTGLSATTSSLGPLPVDLTGLGLPGCFLHVSDDVILLAFGGGQSAVQVMSIPNSSVLVGMQFHQQALVPDPGWPNPLQASMSAAMTGTIGR
jgi:hypothetical protein